MFSGAETHLLTGGAGTPPEALSGSLGVTISAVKMRLEDVGWKWTALRDFRVRRMTLGLLAPKPDAPLVQSVPVCHRSDPYSHM
eukprot:scaffold7468_cov444-Prasinococcus_capsulatus_cf.AAC.2